MPRIALEKEGLIIRSPTRPLKKAEKEHENSANAVDDALIMKTAYENLEKRPVGIAPDFEKRISRCREKEKEARTSLKLVINNRETVTEKRKNISRIYHPYDPLTGKKQDPSTVLFCMIESLVKDMNASHDKQKLMYNLLIPGFYREKAEWNISGRTILRKQAKQHV